jgi:uncharacterized membrane protein HdeD (DUF308 family)
VVLGIGIYAILAGATLIVSSFQIRKLGQALSPSVPAPQH